MSTSVMYEGRKSSVRLLNIVGAVHVMETATNCLHSMFTSACLILALCFFPDQVTSITVAFTLFLRRSLPTLHYQYLPSSNFFFYILIFDFCFGRKKRQKTVHSRIQGNTSQASQRHSVSRTIPQPKGTFRPSFALLRWQ